MTHIDDLPLLEDTLVALGILSSCVVCWPFCLTWTSLFFLLSYFFWRVLTGKLCKYVGTLWVQDRGSLSRAP
jgi:hypothetical protein